MSIPTPPNLPSERLDVDADLAELDREMGDLSELDRALPSLERASAVNKICAISSCPDGPDRQESKGPEASSDMLRAVDALTLTIAPSLSTSARRRKCPSPTPAIVPSLPANLPASLAEHFRHHDVQTQSVLMKKKSDQLSKIAKHGIRETILPRRRRLAGRDLQISYGIAAEKMCGEFYSVRFGDREQEAVLKTHSALEWFLKRLRRSLRSAGISNLAMTAALGVGADGSLHVHGVLLPGARDLSTIQRAVRASAGQVAAISRARQLTMKPVFYGAGAIEYSLNLWNRADHRVEREKLASIFPGQRLTYASTAMSRVARRLHEMSLPPIKPRMKRNTVVVGPAPLESLPPASNTAAAPDAEAKLNQEFG